MPYRKYNVIKATGETVIFNEGKLINSLRKSGANESIINKVMEDVKEHFYDGISTKEIYEKAFESLKLIKGAYACKYKLKQAIMELGPSGYPFEKFVSFLFKAKGFETLTGQILKGKCVTHEIDVVAENSEKIIFVECKYKNNQLSKTNVHVPLYVNSRYLDVKENLERHSLYKNKKKEIWVMTNTKFTEDAIKYSECEGINLLGWDYPYNNSIKEWIELSNLHPITCLSSINSNEKKELVSLGVVACVEIHNNPEILERTSISPQRFPALLKEIEYLVA